MPDTKKCPFCAEEIKEAAIKCRHCGSMVNKPKGTINSGNIKNKNVLLAILSGVILIVLVTIFIKFFYLTPAHYTALANEELKKSNYSAAINFFNKAIKLDKNNIMALNGIAKTYSKMNNPDAAIKNYLNVVILAPKNKEALSGLSELYIIKKDYNSAKDVLDKLFAEGEKNLISEYNSVGQSFLTKKDYKKSIECFNNILNIDPANIASMRCLSESFLKIKDYDKALNQNKKIISILADDIQAHINIADADYQKADYKSSVTWSKKALKLNLTTEQKKSVNTILFNSYLKLGEIDFKKNNYNEARKNYFSAKNIYPKDKKLKEDMNILARSYLIKGESFFYGGSYESASIHFHNVLSLKTGNEIEAKANDYLAQIDYILHPPTPAYVKNKYGQFIDTSTGAVVTDGRLNYLQNGGQPDANGRFDGGCSD